MFLPTVGATAQRAMTTDEVLLQAGLEASKDAVTCVAAPTTLHKMQATRIKKANSYMHKVCSFQAILHIII